VRYFVLLCAALALSQAAGNQELPQMLGPVWSTLDTGECKLTVTANGGVGYTAPDSISAGAGFRFPKTSATHLYYAGMLCGNDSSYVVDRFYGHPAPNLNKDFAIVDSMHRDNRYGGQEYTAVMDDSRHATPKGLQVWMHTVALPVPHGRGVIVSYDYWNNGASPLNGFYSGLWGDFDVGSSSSTNQAFTDAGRRLSFIKQSTGAYPCVGIVLLYPPVASNVSVIKHDIWVYPDTCVTEYQKLRWMNGALHQDSFDVVYDYSALAACGPFDLAPTGHQYTAYAVVGDSTRAGLLAVVDSLQAWFDLNMPVAVGEQAPGLRPVVLSVSPNPVVGQGVIRFGAPALARAKLLLYDHTGRLVDRIWEGRTDGRMHELTWNRRALSRGVYFLRMEGDGLEQTVKTILAR
jgi:hypothetical protein